MILTDGEDRCSRRHPEELRYKIERAATDTTIHMHIFADEVTSGLRLNLVRKLSVPSILWSVHPDRTNRDGEALRYRRCPAVGTR